MLEDHLYPKMHERKTYKELFTKFLIESVWEELGETGQPLDHVQVQISVVPQHQQQWPHSTVHYLQYNMATCDELKENKQIGITCP